MTEKILCLRDLGHESFWKLVHETAQLPSHDYTSDILHGKKALLLTVGAAQDDVRDDVQTFAKALTNLGATALPLSLDSTPASAVKLAEMVAPHAQGADICVCFGVTHSWLPAFAEAMPLSVLNAASAGARPAALVGDMALMRSLMPAMDRMRISWLGGATPMAHALIEASMYVPYELFMALPEWGEPDRNLLGLALSTGSKIFLTREVHLAVDEAHFVYVGAGPQAPAKGCAQGLHNVQVGMPVDTKVMSMADPKAHILLGAPWTSACRAPLPLLHGPSSLWQQQTDYNLRAAKSLLTYLLLK